MILKWLLTTHPAGSIEGIKDSHSSTPHSQVTAFVLASDYRNSLASVQQNRSKDDFVRGNICTLKMVTWQQASKRRAVQSYAAQGAGGVVEDKQLPLQTTGARQAPVASPEKRTFIPYPQGKGVGQWMGFLAYAPAILLVQTGGPLFGPCGPTWKLGSGDDGHH